MARRHEVGNEHVWWSLERANPTPRQGGASPGGGASPAASPGGHGRGDAGGSATGRGGGPAARGGLDPPGPRPGDAAAASASAAAAAAAWGCGEPTGRPDGAVSQKFCDSARESSVD